MRRARRICPREMWSAGPSRRDPRDRGVGRRRIPITCISSLPADVLDQRLPASSSRRDLRRRRAQGTDPRNPTVHYVGGIPTNIRAEVVRPTKDNSASFGLMAARRRASRYTAPTAWHNSLLDLIVFGEPRCAARSDQAGIACARSRRPSQEAWRALRPNAPQQGGNKPGEIPLMQEVMQSGSASPRGDT